MTTFFLVRSVRIERNCFVFSSFACERRGRRRGVGGGEGADHCEEGPQEGEGEGEGEGGAAREELLRLLEPVAQPLGGI